MLTQIAVYAAVEGSALAGDDLRFLRKRVGKSSKDFAELLGLTSEQYSRIENGRKLTASNDKLVRLLVMGLSVLEALAKPS